MKNIALVVAAVLVCAVALPPAFSEDDNTGKSNDKKFHFGDFSNATNPFGEFSNETDVGNLISDYEHKRNEIEKNQREEILAAIKDCREQAKNAENKTSTMQQCKDQLKSISANFRTELLQQKEQLKLFHGSISPGVIQTPEKNKQVLYDMLNKLSHVQFHAKNTGKSGSGHNHN